MSLEHELRLQVEAVREADRKRVVRQHQSLSQQGPQETAWRRGLPPWNEEVDDSNESGDSNSGDDGAVGSSNAQKELLPREQRRVVLPPEVCGKADPAESWSCGISARVARRPRGTAPPGWSNSILWANYPQHVAAFVQKKWARMKG